MNLLQKKQKECHTINIEMNDSFGSLNEAEATWNPDSIPYPLLSGFNTDWKPKARL
jgi:hypothetical protein